MKAVWKKVFGKDFGSLAQGDNKTGSEDKNSLFVMDPSKVKNTPKDRTVTYGRIVVNYRSQKADPNQVHITAGRNIITYPGNITTRTADLTKSKIMEQRVE